MTIPSFEAADRKEKKRKRISKESPQEYHMMTRRRRIRDLAINILDYDKPLKPEIRTKPSEKKEKKRESKLKSKKNIRRIAKMSNRTQVLPPPAQVDIIDISDKSCQLVEVIELDIVTCIQESD
mmetsp:Transcript_25413/g.22563  ORF Transcript_25413/g.22563 Transcript_25413/m.22563 type:complete len:124 (-) Transcript_25413:131-502(-)